MVMFTPGALDRDPKLGQALRSVRLRYFLRVLVRGLAILAAGTLLAIALSAYGLDAFRYSSRAVLLIRAALYLGVGFLAVRFVARPLWRGRLLTSDAAIARYIEEHEPSLDAALRSAVTPGEDGDPAGDRRSRALQTRLVDDVVRRLETYDLARRVERSEIQQATTALGIAAAAGIAFFLLAPAFMKQAFPYLFNPFAFSGRQATPYSVTVKPGNHTIARGSDEEIVARLVGFEGTAELVTRQGNGAWTRSAMLREDDAEGLSHRFMLLAVPETTEYFVESSGTRSDVFRLDVVDRPYVRNIDLEYHLPAYARLEPQKVEGTGDITTLSGADVLFSITPTIPVKGGRLVVQGQEASPIPLEVAPQGQLLSGKMRITGNGFYKVELQGVDGAFVGASPDYVIEAVEDLAPRVTFNRPGRDTQATPIEEVFTEVKAEDDFGVASVDLVYSLNGGPEITVPLHQAPILKDIVAGHTFFLEDMSMKPGDFVSYYARATDVGAPSRQATTDMYFLEARPYRRDFRQAEQGGGQGGGGGGDNGSLSQQQRQVIAATFRLVPDQAAGAKDPKTFSQDSRTVALIQERLRKEVESLVARMGSRGALPEGSPLLGTADELQEAVAKMSLAETELQAPRPKEALPSEQGALAHLQRAEASFREVQVSFGGGGGGGGGQSNASAEELADLYELDLDKLRNQYETLQSGAQEQRDDQVDEALARLQELARRQEQENERARQRSARAPNQGGGGGGSSSQRQLADEAEELGRKLERLTREKPSPALEESARRLKEAAAAMRQQASSPRGQSSGASSGGASPLDRLREARNLLDKERTGRLDRDLKEFQEKTDALKRAQAQIAEQMRDLAQGGDAGASQGSSRADRLRERKDSLASEVADLESRLDRVARESRREQKETSRELQEAANGIRDSKLKEKIRYTKGLVDRAAGAAEPYEQDIAESIGALADRIREASKSMGKDPEGKKTAALDRARELARALDSMGERLRAKGTPSGSEGENALQSSEGSPGSAGAPGQSGSAGSPGQRGNQSGPAGRTTAGGSAAGGRAGGGGRGSGRLNPEETRQLRREMAERASDAGEFRRALEEGGMASPQAAAIAERLQALAVERNFNDPLGLAALTAQVSQDLKMLEYALRRAHSGERPELQLTGSEELPPGYKAMVEEYYRSLARKPKK